MIFDFESDCMTIPTLRSGFSIRPGSPLHSDMTVGQTDSFLAEKVKFAISYYHNKD